MVVPLAFTFLKIWVIFYIGFILPPANGLGHLLCIYPKREVDESRISGSFVALFKQPLEVNSQIACCGYEIARKEVQGNSS